MKKLLLYFILSFITLESYAVNYYNKSSGAANLQTLSNWGTNTDGTGTAPADFTTAGNVFFIRNGASPTIGAAWTVSGTGSKVVLGDVAVANINFTLPSGSGITLTGTIDIAASSGTGNTLTINNQTPPTMGTLHSTSTVIYSATGANQNVAAGVYANLTIAGGNRTTFNIDFPAGTVNISGTYTWTATFSTGSMRHNNGTIILSGTGAQTVPTLLANGSDKIRYYNLSITGARGGANSVTLSTNTSVFIENTFTHTATYGTGSLVTTGSTVDYNGNGAQTIIPINYNNLTISNTRTTNSVTLANGGTIGIAGTFTNTASFTSGNYINTNNTINYNGTGAQTIIPFYYNNLTTSNARTGSNNIILSPTGVIYVAGTFSPTATFGTGGYTNTTSTVEFNGTSSQTIPVFTYNDITISGTRTAAAITLASGTINIQGDATNTATGITSWVNTGNTVNYSGTTAQVIGAWAYNHLTASGNKGTGSTSFEDAKTTKIAGDLTSTATNTTWAAGTSTIEFNGTGAQSIGDLANSDGSTMRFNNLTINNSSASAAVDYATTDVSGNANQRYVSTLLTLTQGRLDIAKVQFIIDGDIAAGGTGSLKGEATTATDPMTEIYIQGTGAISGPLRMDQTTPGATNFVTNFVLDRAGTATCTLGSDLGILNFCNIGCNNGGIIISADGRINTVDINGNTLTLGGANHPTSGVLPNYKFKGSATSKLVFMHNANYIGNTRFYMDQTTPGTTNRLQSISIDRRNSGFGVFLGPNGAYGNPVIVGDINMTGAASNRSFICFNSNELTVEGQILNMNSTNYFRSRNSGSGLSRLNIAGTGLVNGSLFFDPTSTGLSRDVLVGTGAANDLTTLVTTAKDSCNNFDRLTINRSGQTITLGNKIAISGKVVPTAGTLASAGNLVMLSSNTIVSNIDKITSGTSSITGDVVVQSFFLGGTGASPRGFRMISFPVQEKSAPSNLVQIMKQRFIITGNGGTSNTFDAGGTKQPNAATFMSYTEASVAGLASYTSWPTLATATTPGVGYFFFFRGNRTNATSTKVNDASGVFANPESWTATHIGTINSGDIVRAVTLTNNSGDSYNGYNLLGNPYPCTIDFELLRADNTSTLGATTAAGTICMIKRDRTGYITRSGGVSNNTAKPGSASTGSGSTIQYIQPGQGFFVKAIASGNVTFKETHKVPDQAPTRMLSTPVRDGGITLNGSPAKANARTSNEIEAPRQLIRISVEKGEQYEQATLVLEPGNDVNYAAADAIYFGGNDVMLNTLTADNINTCINFLPEIASGDSVKLFVNAVNNLDNADLNFSELTALGTQYAILLKDKYLNTETRIGEGVNKYQFSIDKAVAASFGANRFVITFVPKLVLSVKLLSFTASKTATGVRLAWKTGNEKDNDKFDIERSIDGSNFVKIGEKLGVGNSNTEQNYSFDDKAPVQGANYYRLNAIDKDGQSTFSEIQAVNFDLNANETALSVYPNPVKNELKAVWQGKLGETYTLLVVDLGGKQIKQVKTQKQSLKSDVSHLPKGLYLLQMKGTKGSQGVFKFIKE